MATPRRDGLRDVNTTRHPNCFSPSRFLERVVVSSRCCRAKPASISQMPDIRKREHTKGGANRGDDARSSRVSRNSQSFFW